MNLPPLVTDPLFILLVGIIIVVGGIIGLRLHAFVALLLGAFAVALMTPASSIIEYALSTGASPDAANQMAQRPVGTRIALAFGNTTTQIGIMIAMAAIIGRALLESGGAERIVRSVLKVTGEKKSPIAFAGSSFILGMPVFFDTVFYLMIPLAKAMALRIRKNYALLVMATAAGASMANSLVPPTPGPLFLIGAMNIPMHMMVIGGTVVGIFTVSSGYAYAVWANRRWPIPLRDSPDAPLKDMQALSEGETLHLPSLWLSLLPVLIPLVFISVAGTLDALDAPPAWPAPILDLLAFFGERNVALVTGALVGLILLATRKHTDREALSSSMQAALSSGGIIILITAAGGAFGAMLQQTGVSLRIAELTAGYQMALLPLAFFITAVVRTAQGSATVSMITAAGIMAGMADVGQMGFHHLYIGLSVACGSKLIPWMNDSGFWIVSKMSNLTEQETLKTFSIMQTIMGFAGLIVVMIGAKILPLV